MLSKLLLTLFVIVIAFVVLRQRHRTDAQARLTQTRSATSSDQSGNKPEVTPLAQELRTGAYLFVIFMVGIGAALYYYQWQDDHTIVTVTLHRDNAAEPVTYKVYKYQLRQRCFTTVGGLTVTVASSERMEIEGIAD